ncbi:MAG TPA: DUF4412 domain-containing protein [Thermoanaerobaculia bacterium]
MLRRTILLLALLTAAAVSAGADTLLTLQSHADEVRIAGETQPVKDVQVRIWVSGDRVRRDEGDTSTILRLDRNKLYVVRHPEKTYSEVPLPIDFLRLLPKSKQEVGRTWAEQMKLSVQVKPTSETRKINGWNARRVQMDIRSAMGMKIDTTLWVSQEIEGHRSLNKLTSILAALQPGAADWSSKLEQIEGFPVLKEDSVDAAGVRFKTREELLSVKSQDAPPGSFEPPAGYTPVPYDPLEGIG